MPQTLISVLALVVFTLFAVSQQRRLVLADRSMVRNMVAVMANGVATQTLDEAAAQPFDENTRGGMLTSPNDLTSKAEFSTDSSVDGEPDDVDDWSTFDLSPDSTLASEVRVVRSGDEVHTLTFTRKARVDYVVEDGSGGWIVNNATPTKYKQILVTVYADGIAWADTVRISQVVSCGINCRW